MANDNPDMEEPELPLHGLLTWSQADDPWPALESVSLSHNAVSNLAHIDLFPLKNNCPRIRSLDISNCVIGTLDDLPSQLQALKLRGI